MAYSNSIRKGQIPINCQLCEADGRIKWKCLDCNLLLCERCKHNFHPKFKNATVHKVINIKEVGLNVEQSKFSTECDEHPEQDCCLFCDTCEKSVCPICIAKIHNGHELVEMTKSNATVPLNTKKQGKVDLSIVKEFETSLSAVEHVCILQDNSLWLNTGKFRKLQNIKLQGNNLKVISYYNVLIGDMAVTSSNKLLFTTTGSNLKEINSPNGSITDSCFNVAPLQPTCVHITRDNKVMVGARGGDRPFPATGQRVIIVMDTTGNQQTVYEHDKHNHPLFTYVTNICTTQNGCICVIDHLFDDDRGRLLFLGQSGDVVNSYKGHPVFNTEKNLFKPIKIVSTPSDNIISNDSYNNTLYFFDTAGNLITYYNNKDIGIIAPLSLRFTHQGQLYIGCGNRNNGKLYLMDITGC